MNKKMLIRILGMVVLAVFTRLDGRAQSPPKDWYQLDPKTDGYFGISSNKAYNELLQGRSAQTVIVAVIDGGTDVNHEDLKANLWTNKNEVPGNGIDDDKNGYADDVHGWNFIGGKNGNVQYDTFEITRLYKMLHDRFGDKTRDEVPASDLDAFDRYQAIKLDFDSLSAEPRHNFTWYSDLGKSINTMLADMGNDNPSLEQVEAYQSQGDDLNIAQQILISILKQGATVKEIVDELKEGEKDVEADAMYHYNPDFNPRSIVGDNYEDATQRNYGNPDVVGPDATHGTHVAGIIGAVRNNGMGIDGLADHVQLMIIRVVPDGDERDKDVANGIRYAVDNGAKIINMSFGKAYSYNKQTVDDAVKYAASKDVLLIHASGNDASDNDSKARYPNDQLADGTVVNNWLEVGANSYNNNVAYFSNYGKNNVDVFAPGVAIYSTVPNDRYRNMQGTSMASPVAAGMAAMLRGYFPQLTAPQVKEIMEQSVVKMKKKVELPGSDENKPEMVKLKEICSSGGVINAYNAVQLAIKETAR